MAAATDLTPPVRDLLAAILDALDLPVPAPGETDRQTFEWLQRDRMQEVSASIKALLTDDADLPVRIVSGVLRERIRKLPVTYRRYIPPAEDHPPDSVVCGPGCCSPVLSVHDCCPGPMVGHTVESVR